MALVIRNEHAYVVALSAVWSPADAQLVAFTYQASDKQSLEAIKAQLEKNSKNATIELRGAEDETITLRVAARGYIKSAVSLERYNATGYAGAMLHWRGALHKRCRACRRQSCASCCPSRSSARSPISAMSCRPCTMKCGW